MAQGSGASTAKPEEKFQTADVQSDVSLKQPRRALAIAAVLTSMTAVVIDTGISNVALPSIAASLDVTASDAVLVITAYQTAVVMALLPCAALAERFGYRRIFSSGVALFAAASIASFFAPSLDALLLCRFAEGLGAAAVLSLGVALLRFSVGDQRLGAAISWNALTVALSAAAGPAIGALILSQANWHWIYALNVPLGAAVLLASRALPEAAAQSRRLDVLSMMLNGAAFALAVAAVELVVQTPLWAATCLGAAVVAMATLIRREAPKAAPFLPLDLLREPSFRNALLASVLCFTGQTAGLIALPFFLQHELNQSPATAALYMSTWPLGVVATAAISGRLADRFPTAWVCATGGTLPAISLSGIALSATPAMVIAFTFLGGAGFGLFQVANNRNMFLAAPRTRSAAAGAMQGTARVTGQTAGALLTASLFALAPIHAALASALWAGAFFTLAAGALSLSRLAR